MTPNDSTVRVTHIVTRWGLAQSLRHAVIGPPATGKTALLRDLIHAFGRGGAARR